MTLLRREQLFNVPFFHFANELFDCNVFTLCVQWTPSGFYTRNGISVLLERTNIFLILRHFCLFSSQWCSENITWLAGEREFISPLKTITFLIICVYFPLSDDSRRTHWRRSPVKHSPIWRAWRHCKYWRLSKIRQKTRKELGFVKEWTACLLPL